jgi:hypothetical protein
MKKKVDPRYPEELAWLRVEISEDLTPFVACRVRALIEASVVSLFVSLPMLFEPCNFIKFHFA